MDYKNLKYMGNQDNNTDCGCGTDCCQPKKGKPWVKILFIVVFLAAAAIVTVKLVGKNDSKPQSGCNPAGAHQSSCCDSTGQKKACASDSTKTKSCCPNTKK